jgi:hypothetical protein
MTIPNKITSAELVYRMDFIGFSRKISEDEYRQIYEDAGWNIAGRLGSWYYFSQEASNEGDLQIFNDNASKAAIYKRILAFLLLIGFPMYYQIIFVIPNLSCDRLAFPGFYFFFRIILVLIAILHLSALVKIFSMYRKTLSGIKE